MEGHGAPAHVLFGLDPMWVSACLLVVTYAVIITERINRSIIALLGAGLMVIVGVLDQHEAIRGIDFNTIGLLTGMMILVSISRRSGMFEYMAVWASKKAKAHPAGILLMLQLVTAGLSALLDNVTTVLLIVPVTLSITRELRVPPYPYLFAEVFASNIGGTATLIGDPPNILIGSLVDLSFNQFLINLAPICFVIMIVQAAMIHVLWGKDLKATAEAEARVMSLDASDCIVDPVLLKQSLAVIGGVILAFVLARPLGLEPATIAMFGAAVLMLLDNWEHLGEKASARIHSTFSDVEWITIFFFIGLFVVVHGVEVGGLLKLLADRARRRHGRRSGADRLRHPVGLSLPVGDRRQHPVRRHHDPARQEHGAGVRRAAGDRAPVVVPVARRLSWRQRHAHRRVGQPDGGRHRGTERRRVQLREIFALRPADDDGQHRHRPHLCLAALLLSPARMVGRESTARIRAPCLTA